MNRIPHRFRIFLGLFLSFLAVISAPSLLVTSPYIPTSEELSRLVSIPSFKVADNTAEQVVEKEVVIPTQTPIPTASDDNIRETAPTSTPRPAAHLSPTRTPTHKITISPSIIPTAKQVIPTQKKFPTATPIKTKTPTPVSQSLPTLKPTHIPTKAPTRIPTSTPTPLPTIRPTVTPPPAQPANYANLNSLVTNRPQIGCRNNTISGCPVDTLYNTPLSIGLGWATFYGYGSKQYASNDPGNDLPAEVIKNRKRIPLSQAQKFISDTFMERQSHMTPAQARATNRVIGYAAPRSPADLWKIKYLFGIDDPKNPKARFIGRVMVIDCAAQTDWRNRLATLVYTRLGWSPSLNWITDLSRNAFIQLPKGMSGDPNNIKEGRPGVIFVDEADLQKVVY